MFLPHDQIHHDKSIHHQGGLLLWIAPSGGRDRPNEDGVWMPAKFDPSAVELMRHLISRAKPDGHLFPLAMHSGEMMPPPKSTEKALGERRLTSFVGVGRIAAIVHCQIPC